VLSERRLLLVLIMRIAKASSRLSSPTTSFRRESKRGVPVLIDFGAVKETMTAVVNSQGKATHSIVLRHRIYGSGAGSWATDSASDIYSLGMTATMRFRRKSWS